jgi:hypothetical protein
MATQPSNRQSNEVWSDGFFGGNVPDFLRNEGISEGDKLTYLTRDVNAFTYMIHRNNPFSGTKNAVDDRMYKTRELSELNRFYKVAIGSTAMGDAFHRVIALTNAEAAEIIENTILYIVGLYVTVSGLPMNWGQVYPATQAAAGTNIGPDSLTTSGMNPTLLSFSRQRGPDQTGTYFVDYEQVKVITKGAKDSAGVGFTRLELDRCYFCPSEGDMGGQLISDTLKYGANGILNAANGGVNDQANPAAVIDVGQILLRGMPSYFEGTNAPKGVFKLPTEDINFTQEYKYALEHTLESKIPDQASKLSESIIEISRFIVTRQIGRDKEYTNLMNRKGKQSVNNGQEEYLSGGVIPWLFKDPEHFIIYPQATLTWPQLLWIGRNAFYTGGSSTRTGYIGISLSAALRASFWQQGFLQYNKEESKKFNIEINTLYVSGGQFNLVVSQVMEENGFGNCMLLLDMSKKDAFVPVTNKGWDYLVHKDIAEKGSMIYKEQVVGMFGLRRRYRPFHLLFDFSNALNNTMPFTGVQPSITPSQNL